MFKKIRFSVFIFTILLLTFTFSYATPTTHIWSPSTDVQPYGVFHLTADAYVPVERDSAGNRPDTVTNFGLTTGILPFDKFNAEVGFDHIAGYGALDTYPFYFNWKVGTPEDVFSKFFPALAFGEYMIGTKQKKATGVVRTGYNIFYWKAAKTLSIKNFSLGRFSAGYYRGDKDLLLDANGNSDNDGVLLAWERIMSEISDKLWVCVDYQGGKNSFGAMNYGFAWKFSPNVSVLFGYDVPNNSNLAKTFTVQCDIDFDLFSKFLRKK
ncbi:MAG: hypothetical protein AB1755_05690 [Candidatus Omnitrophota bacterium]